MVAGLGVETILAHMYRQIVVPPVQSAVSFEIGSKLLRIHGGSDTLHPQPDPSLQVALSAAGAAVQCMVLWLWQCSVVLLVWQCSMVL